MENTKRCPKCSSEMEEGKTKSRGAMRALISGNKVERVFGELLRRM